MPLVTTTYTLHSANPAKTRAEAVVVGVERGEVGGELARDDHRRFVDAFRNGAIPGLDA